MRRRTIHSDDPAYEERVDPGSDSGLAAGRMLTQILSLILWVVEALLVTRLVLKLLSANEGTDFVEFIYNLTQPPVAPFVGIFDQISVGTGVLEWASLVTLIIYGIVVALILQLVSSLISGRGRVVRRY